MKKNSVEKIYHIYLMDECILHNLNEEMFKSHWEILNNLVGLMKTDYTSEDLSYEILEKRFEELREERSY